MTFECSALSPVDSNGLQNCTAWVDTTSAYAITQSQAVEIAVAIMGVLVVAFVYRLIVRVL